MKHLSTLAALLITAASFAAPLTGAMGTRQLEYQCQWRAECDAKGMTLQRRRGRGEAAAKPAHGRLRRSRPLRWPPPGVQPAGAYTIVMRDDDARQWAYKGKPVYTYQADQKPGDRAGDNFKDVWHIIKE